MLDQVKLYEYPALADLGTWNYARACFLLQRDWMNFEKCGGLAQGESTHAIASNKCSSCKSVFIPYELYLADGFLQYPGGNDPR